MSHSSPAPAHASRLPPELWDSIIDIIAGERESRTSLIRLTRVCRDFRPRALAALLRELLFSHESVDCANPYSLLEIFDAFPGHYEGLPRKAELGCVEFFGRTLATRTMQLLPRLSRLEDLTIGDLQLSRDDLSTMSHWHFAAVTTLVLRGGDYDDVALDAFLGCFPELQSLSLATSIICVDGRDAPTQLPFTRCRLHLKLGGPYDDPVHGSMQWAIEHREHFVLETLDFSAHEMLPDVMRERLAMFSPELRTLHVRLGSVPEQLAPSVFAILRCRALTALEVHDGRPRDAWNVMSAARVHGLAPTLASVICRPMYYNPRRDEQDLRGLREFLDDLQLGHWRVLHQGLEIEAQ
ncbi:hypothetical protein AURDEDRAFT_169761 [Auricularia subglabra TFB-10046 SS5]|nr:hypothetical protein AURDEDRAFT_169761 [Auricularia subglabra TFB-10046 SS5]